MEKNAQHTLNSLESIEARRISIGGKFRRPTSPYKVTWTRPTYYSLPSNASFTLNNIPKTKTIAIP